jgi:hypothetical protein
MGAARRNIACNGSPRFALCALRFKDPLPLPLALGWEWGEKQLCSTENFTET